MATFYLHGMIFVKGRLSNKLKMKKSIVRFISIAVVSVASSQSLIPNKQKTTIQEDSTKIAKTLQEPGDLVIDSLEIKKEAYKLYKKEVHASYYAGKFHGRKTASGEIYDKNKLTAAHKHLPFGTKVRVTNEANGKSVIVEITDRGPFIKSREIDLSEYAFIKIAKSTSVGIVRVTLEILQK